MPKDSFYEQNVNNEDFQLSNELRKRHEFSDTEVGITHPDLSSFVRLNDYGDIEVFAAPGVGFVISGASRSITLFADTIRLHSRDDGFRWNNYTFNSSSTTYIEPTLIKTNMDKVHPAVYDISHYLDRIKEIEEQETSQPITIRGDFSFGQKDNDISDILNSIATKDTGTVNNLSEEDVNLINNYSISSSQQEINRLLELMNSGASFIQARQRVLEEFE